MDGSSFDRLTQALAGSKSRRRVIAAAAAGLVASALGRSPASAQGDECGQGFEFCDGECHYIETSHEHCGGCGNACGDLVCIEGECDICESIGETTCFDPIGGRNYCADLTSSGIDCGFCGNRCTTGPCENGACISTADCDEGLTECMGQCVDLQANVAHCGACGSACMGIPGPGESSIGACVEGRCEIVCLEGFSVCPGERYDFCADFSTDPNNCGACGNICADGVCTDRVCGGDSAAIEETTPGGEFDSLLDFGDFARSVEQMSLELMRQGLAAFPSEAFAGMPRDTRTRLGKIRDNDKVHLATFNEMPEFSGGVQSEQPVLMFSFADVNDFIARASTLKETTAAAYVLMLQARTITEDVRAALAGIAVVEGRHAAWLAMRNGEVPFDEPATPVLTRQEIVEQLAALPDSIVIND